MRNTIYCTFFLFLFIAGQSRCMPPAKKHITDSLYAQRRETLMKFCDIINKGIKDRNVIREVVIKGGSTDDTAKSIGWDVLMEHLSEFKKLGVIDTSKVTMENYETTDNKETFYAFYRDPEKLKDIYAVTFPNGIQKYFLFRKEKIFSFTVLKMGTVYSFLGY